MRKAPPKLLLLLLFVATQIQAQESETNIAFTTGELKMTFPSVYFKHNSTDYAVMPYAVDSCFKYIKANIKNLNSYPVWRDSAETDQLTNSRIKKLKLDLKKYTPSNKIHFQNMSKAQKVSRLIIDKSDNEQKNYLLTLNSVLDLSGAIIRNKNKYKNHVNRPRLFCWKCWKTGFHYKARRELKKMEKRSKQNQQKTQKKKERRHLVWTGWKTGFHWSTPR